MVNCVVSVYGSDHAISQCSRTCEGGSQRRKVECYSPMEDKVLPDQECNLATRPRSYRTCNNDIPGGEIRTIHAKQFSCLKRGAAIKSLAKQSYEIK